MGIRPDSSNSDFAKKLDEWAERQRRALVRELQYIGEEAVNAARQLPSPPRSVYWDDSVGQPLRNIKPHTPNYIDWTANLRSSVGYVLVVDGQLQGVSRFEPTRGAKGYGTEGSAEGNSYALGMVSKFPKGIALVVVAGMNYAEYVQRKGYDVIDSALHLVEKEMRELQTNAKTGYIQ